jgi:hypothetical protein
VEVIGGEARVLKESAAVLGGREGGEGKKCRGSESLCGSEEFVRQCQTLYVNRTVKKKGDRLRWNKGPGLMGINK